MGTNVTEESKVSQDPLTEAIIACAIEVHRTLGPGLREHAYQASMAHELALQGYEVEIERRLELKYGEVHLDLIYRIDLLVNDTVVLELKAVDALEDVHKAQLITYLKLAGKKVGLLINFNADLLKNGLVRLFG